MVDIRFISYDGEYPCLCFGTLIMEIDDKRYVFGLKNDQFRKVNIKEEYVYPSFWHSGGGIITTENWDMYAESGPWELSDFFDLKKYPEEIRDKKIFEEMIDIMNDKVSWGCCGGCI